MLESAQALLDWIALNPRAALVLLYLVALTDALFLVGAFVPASIVLFGMGAVVALGSLELWPTALIAAAGALTGDAISFALGWRYGEQLFESRWFRRYPEFLAHGRRFFERHGGKGVILARFLGPVRSITPALAGASRMPVLWFLLADFCAAVVWALVYLVPGVVFGASLGLAAEVATRLAGLLVLNIGLLIAAVWGVRTAIAVFNTRAESWVNRLLDWSRRHRRLGRFGPGLADPQLPETPALIAVGLLILGAGGLWLLSFGGVGWRDFPGPLDGLTQQALADLATPWGLALARGIARLGEWPVYGSVAAAVLGALMWRRRLRAAAHWFAALLFGGVVTLALESLPLLAPPAVFFGHIDASEAAPRDLAMPTIIYGYAATLYVTLRPAAVRLGAYGVASALLLLIALSRLVLAQEWISLNSLALVLGLLWVGALTLGYRRHRPERLFAGSFALPVTLAFAVAAGTSWGVDRAARARPPAAPPQTMTIANWLSGGWTSLPAARQDLRGRSQRPFDLQWAASAATVQRELELAGWQALPPLTLPDALRWLTATTRVAELAVLPQVHAGEHARLTLRQGVDDDRQRLIRLWDSGVRVVTDGGEPAPIWLGTVVEQRARSYYRLLRYPVTEKRPASGLDTPPPLPAPTAGTRLRAVERDGHRLWLMAAPRSVYTEALPEAPAGDPVPLE